MLKPEFHLFYWLCPICGYHNAYNIIVTPTPLTFELKCENCDYGLKVIYWKGNNCMEVIIYPSLIRSVIYVS